MRQKKSNNYNFSYFFKGHLHFFLSFVSENTVKSKV